MNTNDIFNPLNDVYGSPTMSREKININNTYDCDDVLSECESTQTDPMWVPYPIVENIEKYIKELEDKVKVLSSGLEEAILGLEWWGNSHPESASSADHEVIDRFKSLIKGDQQ